MKQRTFNIRVVDHRSAPPKERTYQTRHLKDYLSKMKNLMDKPGVHVRESTSSTVEIYPQSSRARSLFTGGGAS